MLNTYPFLASEKKRLVEINLRLEDIIGHPIYGNSIELAKKDILEADPNIDPQHSIIVFTVSKILLSIADNSEITARYATYKASKLASMLEKEDLSFLIKIAREEFDIDIKTEDSLRIHFTDFLKYRPEFLKLSQAALLGGYIQIDKLRLVQILSEAIKKGIIDGIPKKSAFPGEFEMAAAVISTQMAPKKKERERPKVKNLRFDALPPCIQGVIDRLESGSANHNAHFVLSTFLMGLGLSDDAILEIFKRSPKYKEKMTRYQLEFAKQRGYTCPACSSIRNYGLCTSDCPKKHPISNYFHFARRAGPTKFEEKDRRSEVNKE